LEAPNNGHIVVVGGAGAIGGALVGELLAAAVRVTVIDRDGDMLDDLRSRVERFGVTETYVGDATAEGAADEYMAKVARRGPLGGLVYLVSEADFGPIEDLTSAAFDRMLAVNIRMQAEWARAYVRHCDASGGSIVLIGSIYGLGSSRGRVVYGAVRGALIQLVRGLALEWAQVGVRVNAVAPGWTDGPSFRRTFSDVGPFERRTPLGRLGTPDDIAGPIRFLLSDDSRWITGQTLVDDGGVTAYLGTGDPDQPWPGDRTKVRG